jgi:hypothetical protein
MSAYTKMICPCTTRQALYKKYSPDALMLLLVVIFLCSH